MKTSSILFATGASCVLAFGINLILNRPVADGNLVSSTGILIISCDQDTKSEVNRKIKQCTLKNVGSSSVQIESIQSGCGCTKVVAEPSYIPAGSSAILTIEAIAPSTGYKDVPIAINYKTRSQKELQIQIAVRLYGCKKPPYIESAQLEYDYETGLNVTHPAILSIISYEIPNQTKAPIINFEKPNLRAEFIERKMINLPGNQNIVFASYRYKVTEDGDDNAPFSSAIKVQDPWTEESFKILPIFRKYADPIRIVPSVIRFDSHNVAIITIINDRPENCVKVSSNSRWIAIEPDGQKSSAQTMKYRLKANTLKRTEKSVMLNISSCKSDISSSYQISLPVAFSENEVNNP